MLRACEALEKLRDAPRLRHSSLGTEKTYLIWFRNFRHFVGEKQPGEFTFETSPFRSQILRPRSRQRLEKNGFEPYPLPTAALSKSLIHSGISPCSGKDRKEREVCA
jgi:hypothetical protein